MDLKKRSLKGIQAEKEGEPTLQDDRRLKTWKEEEQGSRVKKQGFERALRNIQRSKQRGHSPNKVDSTIVKSYVKETPDQLSEKQIKALGLLASFIGGPFLGRVGAKVLGPVIRRTVSNIAGSGAKAAKAAKAAKKAAAKKVAPKIEPPSRLRKTAAATLNTKQIGKGRRTPLAYVTPKGKPGAGRRHGLKPSDIKIARNIRTAAPAAVPLGLTSALIALDKKAKPQAAMPEPGARATENAAAEKKRAAAKKKRRAEERRHAEEFVGTARGAVDPKHIIQDDPPKSKRALKPLEGGKREVTLPKWLGGGKMTVDSSDAAFDYMDAPELNLKRGGRLKKKTKSRKRAALRGHRAELRGG